MENKDRFEPTEKKENGFAKAMKSLGKYFKGVFYDFFISFKYNNMKLPALLVAAPGILLGFFLGFHAPTIKHLAFSYTDAATGQSVTTLAFDYTGIVLFVLMLMGILNIFFALNVSGKKNLGSVIQVTITTAVICACGAAYLYAIFLCGSLVSSGHISFGEDYSFWNNNSIVSVVSIIASMVLSVAGVILGFIFYDRTYEKVDR